jgi:uncharacterized protein YacL
MGILGLLGWEAGLAFSGVDQLEELTWGAARLVGPAVVAGLLIGFVITPWLIFKPARSAMNSLRALPTAHLLAGSIGLCLGLMIAALMAYPLSMLPAPFGVLLPFVGVLIFGYLGATLATLRQKELFSIFQNSPLASKSVAAAPIKRIQPVMLLDTSVIIDGRIADIAETGFLWATLAVPRFVLNELQYIADSSDVLRRNRGRRGLEMLDRLRGAQAVKISFLDQDPGDAKQVDDKLVSLAMELKAAIVTNDYNLNRVASLQGIQVLNVNELANAVKSVVLPGEELGIKVIQEGKEANQGVGYLDDGTMVVVENGRRFLSREISVQVTKVLQTNAGRLIFAVPDGRNGAGSSEHRG